MRAMTEGRRPTLEEALRTADWESMLPGLIAYGARRLRRYGWKEGIDLKPSAMDAEELVSEAVTLCLEGARVWPDDIDLETFLRGVMRSVASHRRESIAASNTRSVDHRRLEKPPRDEEDAERIASAKQLLARVREVVGGDEELLALLDVMEAGHTKRASMAEALGWPVMRVKAARIKLNRRLAAAGFEMEEES